MKQYLAALALMLTFSVSTVNAAPKHRHHQPTAVDVNKNQAADPAAEEGIEAYSDNTSFADSAGQTVVTQPAPIHRVSYDPDDYDDPISFWSNTIGWGVGGVLLASLILLIVALFLLAPLIILALILRYFIKRHNDRVTLAEKAMESGQQIPESMKPVDKQSDEYLWKRGVKNAAIGAGLIIMFWFWGSDALAGIGALVLCFGLGQMFLGHRPKDKQGHNEF